MDKVSQGKPLIAILMAIYNPREDWLKEQLLSLNAQDYPSLSLYIREDCSPDVPYEKIKSLIKECITSFPVFIERNEKNLGSNATFERLTNEAQGVYFAYCDQDDIWLPHKLTRLQKTIEEEGAELVCSDMYIIDGAGKRTADSIKEVRRRHILRSGEGLADQLLFQNWVIGCTMLVKSDSAKSAMPFCPLMVHDNYLALYCAEKGKIISLKEPLINYRIHGGNQTGVLTGVNSKADYLRIRLQHSKDMMEWLKENYKNPREELNKAFEEQALWIDAREEYLLERKGLKQVWKNRKFSPKVVLLETFMPYIPESVFRFIVKLVRRNVI